MNGFIVKSCGRLSANCDQLSSAAVVAEPKITVEMLPRKMSRRQTLGHIWSELKLLFFRRPSVFLPKSVRSQYHSRRPFARAEENPLRFW
jgi:hypothetical protein